MVSRPINCNSQETTKAVFAGTDDQNCLRRCMKVAHMAKLSPIRVLQLSVKRLAQYVLARSIGSSTPNWGWLRWRWC